MQTSISSLPRLAKSLATDSCDGISGVKGILHNLLLDMPNAQAKKQQILEGKLFGHQARYR